jgi:hypothetical protein
MAVSNDHKFSLPYYYSPHTDDEIIDHIREEGISDSDIKHLFCDKRLAIMEFIYSIMSTKKSFISFDQTKFIPVAVIVAEMVSTCQVEALESLYQASIKYDFKFDFIRLSFDCGTSARKLSVLNWFDTKPDLRPKLRLIQKSSSTEVVIITAMKECDMDILEWLTQRSLLHYRSIVLEKNPMKLLNWMEFQYDEGVIEFKYDDDMICRYMESYAASPSEMEDNLILILTWLWERRDRFEFKYDIQLLELIRPITRYLEILDWFFSRRSEIEFKYDTGTIDNSCNAFLRENTTNPVHILEWFYSKRYELEFKYTSELIDRCQDINALNWLYERREELPLLYTDDCIYNAVTDYDSKPEASINIIKWWYDKRHELEFKYASNIFEYMSLDCIRFWLENIEYPMKLNLRYVELLRTTDINDDVRKLYLENIDKFHIDEYDRVYASLNAEVNSNL